MVPIDIACLDPQAARRRDKSNRLPPDYGELELNPVVRIVRTVWPSLNAGQIWTRISVKIGNRKLWAGSNRGDRRILNLCARCCPAANEGKEEQQTKRPKSIPSRHKPIPWSLQKIRLAGQVFHGVAQSAVPGYEFTTLFEIPAWQLSI